MKVIGKGEYGEVISRYFQHGFPKAATISKSDLLEILTDLLVGSTEYRYGPKPKVESLYTIRQTLSKAIELSAPIPVLVPWGGRKIDGTLSVDVAEVSALKQLIALDEVVKRFFAPGLHIHIRIEDLGASWLYRTETNPEPGIEQYSSDMVRLVNLLKGGTSIEPIREEKLMNRKEYFRLSETFSELIEGYVKATRAYKDLDINTIPEYKSLLNLGWKGEIPKEQQDFYIDKYKKLYPNKTEAEYVFRLADYLGGAIARYRLHGKAEPDSAVGSYIQITFVPPVPGTPAGMFNNTLYYRTVPESSARTHIAPWRGKGYLKLVDDIPVAKITHSYTEIETLQENEVHLVEDGSDNEPLVIRADYQLAVLSYLSYPPHAMAM